MSTVTDIITAGDRLYAKRENLLSFWQDVTENFAPHQADYTSTLTLGEDYASNLATSYPLIVARDLCEAFGTMRPSDRVWATMGVEGLTDHDGKVWLEWATGVQRRAMYDRPAQFIPSAKACDRDYGLTGQSVMTVEVMPDKSSLLYRRWHLRDTVWSDGITGAVECVHRNWKPHAYELAKLFGEDKLHEKVRDCLRAGKDPYAEIQCRHVVMPADMYHGETKFRTKLVSIYIDVDNDHVMEATGQNINSYVIPRWERLGMSQYAISPAVLAALPEARLLQAMTLTLLEAGEKHVRPPLLAVQEAISGTIDIVSGGVTYLTADYDERMGEALRPLTQDKSGMPIGLELQQRSEMLLRQAMYTDRFNLPVRGPQMTAYEFSQRMQEYIRSLITLFEPFEIESNGTLCERTFEVGAANGLFGPPETWPRSVRGADIRFNFVSPWRDAQDKARAEIFSQALQLTAQAVSLDPGAGAVFDASTELRAALSGIGVQAKSIRPVEEVAAIKQAQAEAAQQEQMLNAMEQASTVAKNLSSAVPA